jgi:predicted ArsR family transcriptional regulator
LSVVGSRDQLLLVLRRRPDSTVTDLAAELAMTGMGVRRHLTALAAAGLVERSPAAGHSGPGRPPAGWRLSTAGMETFPRRYDALALDLLEELDPAEVAGALDRRNDTQVAQYQAQLAGCTGLLERVTALARLRDQAGYLAECAEAEGGALVLTEGNCAVHRVAEHHPVVCAAELSLLRRVLGPEVEVTRISHTMAGDTVCAYCIRPTDSPAGPG